MNVVLLSKNDWANMAYIYEKCFERVGINAKSFSSSKHHYGYPEQATRWKTISDIKPYVEKADVVMFFHSEYIDTGVNLKNKVVCVVHTGSKYRQNSNKINKIFNPIVDMTLSGGDVLGMGAKNEIWIQPAVDTEKIKPIYSNFKNIVKIGHYPSGSKGYSYIEEAVRMLKRKNFKFSYDPKNVSWEENLKRMSDCDIYIEAMNEVQGEIPLFIFGIQAVEAAALGKVVCTRFPMLNDYEKVFGKCGLLVTNTPFDLKNKLEELLSMADIDFLELQKKSRKWVVDCHSYEVIGKKFKNIFEDIMRSKNV